MENELVYTIDAPFFNIVTYIHELLLEIKRKQYPPTYSEILRRLKRRNSYPDVSKRKSEKATGPCVSLSASDFKTIMARQLKMHNNDDDDLARSIIMNNHYLEVMDSPIFSPPISPTDFVYSDGFSDDSPDNLNAEFQDVEIMEENDDDEKNLKDEYEVRQEKIDRAENDPHKAEEEALEEEFESREEDSPEENRRICLRVKSDTKDDRETKKKTIDVEITKRFIFQIKRMQLVAEDLQRAIDEREGVQQTASDTSVVGTSASAKERENKEQRRKERQKEDIRKERAERQRNGLNEQNVIKCSVPAHKDLLKVIDKKDETIQELNNKVHNVEEDLENNKDSVKQLLDKLMSTEESLNALKQDHSLVCDNLKSWCADMNWTLQTKDSEIMQLRQILAVAQDNLRLAEECTTKWRAKYLKVEAKYEKIKKKERERVYNPAQDTVELPPLPSFLGTEYFQVEEEPVNVFTVGMQSTAGPSWGQSPYAATAIITELPTAQKDNKHKTQKKKSGSAPSPVVSGDDKRRDQKKKTKQIKSSIVDAYKQSQDEKETKSSRKCKGKDYVKLPQINKKNHK